MKDRIKELMGKTLDSEFSHTWDTMTYEDLLQFSEKFAELIVRECIEAMRLVPYESDREFGDEVIYQEAVKKHFGVE